MSKTEHGDNRESAFRSAEWYDRTINWEARLGREIPLLCEVFGPPGDGGIVDAGCGPGRQVCGLAEKGYRVIAADISEDMLAVAEGHGRLCSGDVSFVACSYAELGDKFPGDRDGVYCIGNGLAVAGSERDVRDSLIGMGRCLRPGGRLFVQVLNFAMMRQEEPCVRGPRVVTVDGVEYVSTRHYHFNATSVDITSTTLWNDCGWQRRSWSGRLYPIELSWLETLLENTGLRLLYKWGSYAKEQFDVDRSQDLIIVAERRSS